MEIRIRNVDPAIVAIIDEYAKENQESRSEYLRRLLEFEAQRKLLEKSKRLNEDNIKPIYNILEIILNRIEDMDLEIQKLLALIIYIGELDKDEVRYLLQNVIFETEE